MRAARSQRIPSAERRKLLLAAAAERFATDGYHATDVASIAADTGVTKVIAYRAFGSKQALYQAVLNHHRDELLGTLVASQELDDADTATRIHVGLDAWFGYVEGHPFAWRLLFRDTTGIAQLEEQHREMRTQARAVLVQLLVAHLGVKPADAPTTAEFLRAGVVGIALWWLEHPEFDRITIVDRAERLINGALTRQP